MSSDPAPDSDGAASANESPLTGRAPAEASGDSTARIRAALDEVRREVRKAAVIHAAVDAALIALAANFLVILFDPEALRVLVRLPDAAVALLRGVPVLGRAAPTTVGAGSLLALILGVVAFASVYLLRMRRSLVERFEAANPALRAALRTARDAVEAGHEGTMAKRLYDDVIERLGETSAFELVAVRRVAVTAVLVVLVSLASVQIAVVDPDLGGLLGPGETGNIERPDDDGLQDGDQVLGDREDVQAGEELQNISVTGSGEVIDEGATGAGDNYGDVGGGSGAFDSQQAGFRGEQRIEDAELVREYNLRIREIDDEETTATTQ
ncbi:MAG: hypothetical protein ABEI27_07485 [Halobellus sp.]|uniref:DUF7502 family protein n=1 Tax=Halobellus sp. TaxID=1979212 RepID=UPI0035D3DEF1